MTFISALLHQQGLTHAQMSIVWAVLGLAVMAAAFAWGRIFSKLHNGQSLATVLLILMIGITLPLLGHGLAMAILSALLFGGSVLAAPPAVTHFIRDALPRQYWVSAMGALTVCFGVGQIIGPELVGHLADSGGGIDAGFGASAAVLGLGLVVALCQGAVARRSRSCFK
jgi:predicted MFS family arabinose efflux permease